MFPLFGLVSAVRLLRYYLDRWDCVACISGFAYFPGTRYVEVPVPFVQSDGLYYYQAVIFHHSSPAHTKNQMVFFW